MRRKLIALTPLLAGAVIAIAGCSGAAPLPGSGSGAAVTSTTGSAGPPSGPGASPASTVTDSEALTGLSAACAAVIDGQSAIANLFAEPVDGHRLDDADVRKAFGAVGPDIPSELLDDIRTLHGAADRAVGASDVTVAAILAEQQVADAMAALSGYVEECTPETS